MELPVIIQGGAQIVQLFWKIQADSRLARLQEEHQKQQTQHLQERILTLQLQREKLSGQPQQDSGSVGNDAIDVGNDAVDVGTPTYNEKPYSAYLSEYGQQSEEDVSVGCVPCTRAHLSTVAAALRQGDTHAAQEEITALLEYDLTPEKLAKTPPEDRAVLEKYAGELQALQGNLQAPAPELVSATASLKEAMRFARAGDDIYHPEVQVRVSHAEDAVNALERVTLSPENVARMSPEQVQTVQEVLPELRKARQDLINHVQTPRDLEVVTGRIAEISRRLNPPPEPGKVQAVAQQANQLNSSFRKDIIELIKERSAAHV